MSKGGGTCSTGEVRRICSYSGWGLRRVSSEKSGFIGHGLRSGRYNRVTVNTRHSAKQGDRQTTVATVPPIEPAAGLSGDDVSAVIRLVLETCDRWDDPLAWREHLLHGA